MYMATITNFMDPAWPGSTDCSYSVTDYELSQPLLCNGNSSSTVDASINDLSQIFAPAVQIYPVGVYASSNLGTVPVTYNTLINLPSASPPGTILVIANNTDASANGICNGWLGGLSFTTFTVGPGCVSVFLSIGYLGNTSGVPPNGPSTGNGLTLYIPLVNNQFNLGSNYPY